MKKYICALFLLALCLDSYAQWALPHISVSHVRTEPRHGAELSTQALMGNPLRVDSVIDNGWVAVTMPDGYTGYINGNSLTILDDTEFDKWRGSERCVVISSHETRAFADSISYTAVTDLVAGDIVVLASGSGALRTEIILPDGRNAWVFDTDIKPLSELRYNGVEPILKMASLQMGAPYLWGGLSTKGMDCSGLTKLAFFSAGYILPRDASQQALAGEYVMIDSIQPGDLVFYGNPDTKRINHVAIYEGDGYVIEAAGRVRRTPVHDAGNVITCRRLNVPIIPTVTTHSWY